MSGRWTSAPIEVEFSKLIYKLWPQAKVWQFEADERQKAHNPDAVYALLGNCERECDFFTVDESKVWSTGSSIYREESEHYTDPIILKKQMTTLDRIMETTDFSGNWKDHGLVKLDTQASELDILEGAGGFFRTYQPRLVLMEVSVFPCNRGGALMSDVICYMDKIHYRTLDVFDLQYAADNRLMQMDLLFQAIHQIEPLKLTVDSGVSKVDLTSFARFLAWNPEYQRYFLARPGDEHHSLLSFLAQQLPEGSKVVDLGTLFGSSALALAHGLPSGRIITYDIHDNIPQHVGTIRGVPNIEFKVCDGIVECQSYLDARLILLDVDPHDGVQERDFIERMIRNGFQGLVVCDDIHCNPAMEAFWGWVPIEKHDLTFWPRLRNRDHRFRQKRHLAGRP